jgi:hypothetical protein
MSKEFRRSPNLNHIHYLACMLADLVIIVIIIILL